MMREWKREGSGKRSKMFARMKFAGVALIGLLLLAAPRPAAAQSCALCYTQAASSGARMIQALKSGILILIVPPTLLSIGMIFVLYHKRYQVRSADDTPKSDTW
jgi:hypothetical protein